METQHFIGEYQFKNLCQWANQLAGFYACQAYLVGSAIKKSDYRDVDIVFVLSDDDFEMRFGNKYDLWNERVNEPLSNRSWRYYIERIKRVRDGYARTLLDIDVKIQCETEFLGHSNEPMMRLDTSPFLPHLEARIFQYRLPAAEEEIKQQDDVAA